MIRCLEEDVRARLRSGVTINSLGQCVEELILNSIDAKATCVAIRVDLEAFKIQVVDNGSGMGREDLNAMGKRYFTSKCSSVGDLENPMFYGFRGEAVASIANLASVVEVSSKINRTAKTFVKLFHNGQALEVCEAELNRPSGGTTVTVCNLFHQLPVRRKCMDPVLEFERVRQKVEAVSLMHPSVSLSLRNNASCSMVLQLPKTRDVHSRFCQIYGLGRSQKLREINHKSGGFELSGYISIEGHYNKNMQFLYVNRRLVLKTRIHKLIDFLLRKESVICKAKSGPASRQASSSPGRHRCGPESYGIFVLNVICAYSDYDVCLEPAKTLIEFQNWDVVLACVEEGVKTFLKREHLFIEPCNEDVRECHEDNDFCLYNAPVLKPSVPDEKSIQDNFKKACDVIADSYEMCNLQSKDVKRKSSTGQKPSSLTESSSNLQETKTATSEKNAEPSGPWRNTKAEIPLLSKDDTASDFIVSNISEQEPKGTNNSPKASNNHLKPSENLDSSFSRVTRSEIRKTDSCSDLQHCAENNRKDMGSRQDKVVQKSSTARTLDNVIQLPCEREDPTETAVEPNTVSGISLMRLCNARRERETAEVTDDAGRRADSSIPLKLCSASLTACVRQSEPPHECEQTETSLALNTKCRAGPASAKDAFGQKVNFPIQPLNATAISSTTNKEYTPHTGEISVADGSERLENKTLSNQLNEKIAVPIATSKRQYETLKVTGLPLATSSGIPHNKVIKSTRRQIALPRPQPSKKLSLSTQMGSLEKFKRYYGRVKYTLATPLSELSECHLTAFNSQAKCDFSKNKNENHSNLSTCEIPTMKETISNNSRQISASLEGTSCCGGETSQDKGALCQSPLSLSDYSQISKKNMSCKMSPGSLSSKLSRKKSDHEVEQPDEQFQTASSGKDDHFFDLESSNKDFLDNVCQNSKSSVGTLGECNYNVSKEDTCWQSSGRRAESMRGPVSPSPLSSIEGKYAVPSSSVLSLPAVKDCTDISCKDKSTILRDQSSEQSLKDTESPHMTFPRNSEFAADNTGTGDTRNNWQSSDWLQDFDVSSGKTIYINKATGLSTYSTPPTERFQAPCVQDTTTMAVNVVLENGDAGESLQSLLSEWDNPVFVPCPEIAVDVTSGQADNLAVKIHNILYPYRFTKDMVHSMQVLQQVDNKFIACLINTRNETDKKEGTSLNGNLLILVDQHAAHERIRLEQLIADSYEKEAAACGKKKLLSSSVSPPLEIEVTEEQRRLLRCCYKNLEDLGLELSFPETNNSLILVRKVPQCFVEREANELRRKRQPVTKSIVEELIQEQVELVQTTGGGARGTLPLTFLKVLASQACHGAIKFNEHLTLEDSYRLIEALSSCQLPFQCAHGRPSMMPLADIDHLQQEKQPKPNLVRLRKMARAWHLFAKKRP